MKRSHRIGAVLLLVGILAGGGLFWASRTGAVEAIPGSEFDPLVSKSYVDELVSLKVVTLSQGQRLIGEAGTELILRAGSATAITTKAGGLSDVTAGTDIKDGQKIPLNHLLIVPVADGRGVRAEGDIILLVRGRATRFE